MNKFLHATSMLNENHRLISAVLFYCVIIGNANANSAFS